MKLENVKSHSQTKMPKYYCRGNLDVGGKVYTIAPILKSDREEAIQFFATVSGEFYGNGRPLDWMQAARCVDVLVQRHLNNEPWSAYLIKRDGKIIGVWTIGYDKSPGDLHLAAMITESYRNTGILKEAIKWTKFQLIPELNAKGAVVPIFIKGFKIWKKSLDKAFVRATAHPDHIVSNRLMVQNGFLFVKQYNEPSFAGEFHDGRRNFYEIPVIDILNEQTAALQLECHAV